MQRILKIGFHDSGDQWIASFLKLVPITPALQFRLHGLLTFLGVAKGWPDRQLWIQSYDRGLQRQP
jgi:hypothetical protein